MTATGTPQDFHVSRHWDGPGSLEEDCPCPQQACGMILVTAAHPQCPEHRADRSFRSMHPAQDCPGREIQEDV